MVHHQILIIIGIVIITIIFISSNNFVQGKKKSKQKKTLPTYYNVKSGVKELRATHFPGKGAKYIWLIQFYKQNCRKCYAMKSAFSRAAQQVKKHGEAKNKIRFGSFDCTGSHNSGNKKICADHGAIDGLAFPQIVIIKNGKPYTYEMDGITAQNLIRFAYKYANIPYKFKGPTSSTTKNTPSSSSSSSSDMNDKKPSSTTSSRKKCGKKEGVYHDSTNVINLCHKFFPKKGKHKYNWIVNFYSEHDGNSKWFKENFYKRLYAEDTFLKYKSSTKLGAINCVSNKQNRNLCKRYNINKFPTLMGFKINSNPIIFNEKNINWNTLSQFVASVSKVDKKPKSKL